MNDALRHYTGSDDVTVMQKCLTILQKSGDEQWREEGALEHDQLEAKEQALEMIADKVELIDNARGTDHMYERY